MKSSMSFDDIRLLSYIYLFKIFGSSSSSSSIFLGVSIIKFFSQLIPNIPFSSIIDNIEILFRLPSIFISLFSIFFNEY